MEDKSIVSVIFGASGDLTWRKLVPALYDMYYRGLLPGGFKVLGVGRAQLTDESFREKMKEGLDRFVPASFVDQQRMAHFLQQLHYHEMDTKEAKDYEGMRSRLVELSKKAQELVAKDLPVLYLIDPQWHIAVSEKLANYQPYN